MSVPVTILSGTLGAGKTTLLNHVLTGEHGYELAVLVNDVGEVNVDAEVVQRRVDSGEEIVELSNGCICCGMQGELDRAVIDLAINHEFDALLVEPSGISEPEPVAERFVQGRAAGLYDLSSVATVVDAKQFYDAFAEGIAQRRGEDSNGERPLSDLLVDGVEFCDTLIVNKTDLVTEDKLETVLETLRGLQPGAKLRTTEFGHVDPGEILDTGRFDHEEVPGAATWRRTLQQEREDNDGEDESRHSHDDGGEGSHHENSSHDRHEGRNHNEEHDHRHPPEVYGVDSFVYHRVEPMDPERLAALLQDPPESVIRAKGWLHVAGRPDHALDLSLAGSEVRVDVAGRWIASLPDDRQEGLRRAREPEWTDAYGDRQTQLVIIGKDMHAEHIEAVFDGCLLRSQGDETDGTEQENPFPDRESQTLQYTTSGD